MTDRKLTDMERALAECEAYNLSVGLDETMMRDIAFDHCVAYKEMKQLFDEVE